MRELSDTAARQGDLWGYAAQDWAEMQESAYREVWDAVLDAAHVGPGMIILDAGCGTGGALGLAAERGAEVYGIDPSVKMITVARERFPKLDLRIGELEDIHFPNGKFDAAISVNALQYTVNPQVAAHELGRVCRAGGRIVLAVHGDPGGNDMSTVTEAIFALFPKRPAGGPFALSSRENLEGIVASVADLKLEGIKEVEHDSTYPNLEAAVRGMMAAGGSRRAAEIFGEQAVSAAVRSALQRFEKEPGGELRLHSICWIAIAVKQSVV